MGKGSPAEVSKKTEGVVVVEKSVEKEEEEPAKVPVAERVSHITVTRNKLTLTIPVALISRTPIHSIISTFLPLF